MRQVLDRLQPAIDKALGAYAPNASDITRDRARLMAAQALTSYDPKKGAKLSTHVYGHLQALKQVAHRLGNPMPVPELVRRDQGRVLQAAQLLRDTLNREPSDDEVGESAGVSYARVRRVMRAARIGVPLSAFEGTDEDGGGTAIGKTRTAEDDWMEAIDHDLPAVDKLILRYRTGYDGHPVLPGVEIARRLNLSPAAVSQHSSRIQARLDAFRQGSGV